ncbi:MAG: hypothetical protein DHS20C14_17310 [Phycisphaeraceae bacterium]|nr:MAG: hypothetical protein DHS20C14_17310 [Phycisphaeraceae bacterium]
MLTAITHSRLVLLGIAAISGFLATTPAQAQPTGFGITDEASYDRFKDAVRTAEYVRELYLVGFDEFPFLPACGSADDLVAQPRTLATLASTMAFLERNPSATAFEAGLYLEAIDEELASMHPSDPGLTVPENLITALRFSRVVTGPHPLDPGAQPGAGTYAILMTGFDTAVGERALELIGITVPGYNNFDTLETRTRALGALSAYNIGTNADVGLMLVRAFMGQTPLGVQVDPGIPQKIFQFLCHEGYPLGAIGAQWSEFEDINAAIDALPSYADFVSEMNDPYDPVSGVGGDPRDTVVANSIQQALREAVYETLDITEFDLLSNLPDAITLEQSLALTPAQRDFIEQQRIANLRIDSRQRAAMLANASLLFDNNTAASYVATQLNFGSAAVGANKHWANIRTGLEIGFATTSILYGTQSGNFSSTLGGFSDIVFKMFGAAEGSETAPVSNDDIHEQVLAVRSQLQSVQNQLNKRFDAVDSKLAAIYVTMTSEFDRVIDGLGDIESRVDEAIFLILEQNAALRRFENTFTLATQDQEYADFAAQVDSSLLEASEGRLPLLSGGILGAGYDGSQAEFFSFTNNTSRLSFFAGSADFPFDPFNADTAIGDGAVSNNILELAALAPFFNGSSSGIEDIGAVEPWAHGSAAVTELARFTPWFAADRFPTETTAIDLAILRGQSLLDFAAANRVPGDHGLRDDDDNVIEESALYARLMTDYQDSVLLLGEAIDQRVRDELENQLVGVVAPDAAPYLNLWPADAYIDPWSHPVPYRLDKVEAQWDPSSSDVADLQFPDGFSTAVDGYTFFVPDSTPGLSAEQIQKAQMLREVAFQQHADGNARPIARWYLDDDANFFYLRFELTDTRGGGSPAHTAFREVVLIVERQSTVDPSIWNPYTPSYYTTARDDTAVMVRNIWAHRGLKEAMTSLVTLTPQDQGPWSYYAYAGSTVRITWGYETTGILPAVSEDNVMAWYHDLRGRIRTEIMDDFDNESSPIGSAAFALNNSEALLDAYVSVITPGILESSDFVRAALRGSVQDTAPGADSVDAGIRMEHAFGMLQKAALADNDPAAAFDPEMDFWALPHAALETRADLLRRELATALGLPVQTSPISAWTLAELRDLRANAARLAVDDRYDDYRDGHTRSVLDNDTYQVLDTPGGLTVRQVEVVDPVDAFGDPADLVEQWPAHGTVAINPDGTFVYTPNDPGFEGVDRFEYITRVDVSETGVGDYTVSAPAFVRVMVTPGCGVADVDGNGVLNVDDIEAFVGSFLASDPVADIDANGVLNVDDIEAFVSSFLAGCG